MAAAQTEILAAAQEHRLSKRGFVARAIVAGGLAAFLLTLPLWLPGFYANEFSRAAIFAIIGLSLNILTGHAGQISLGHQAFVGVGAFTSGYMVSENGLSFLPALFIAGAVGGLSAAILGVVALRLRGLYLALLTLAYGEVAEGSIFGIRALTRGGEGMPAPRPTGFESDNGFFFLCLLVLGAVLLLDWRLVKSKAGRAIMAIRHDDRVAATMGVNVTFYKIFAFVLSGFIAGVAGSLFAHREQVVVAEDFVITVALTWVFMTVVGGLGSRAGVVIGSAFFALFPLIFREVFGVFFDPARASDLTTTFARAVPLLGAMLLVLTLTLYPGGIGQQLTPIRRWLAGGPFLAHHRRKRPGDEAAAEPAEGLGAESGPPSGEPGAASADERGGGIGDEASEGADREHEREGAAERRGS